LDRSGISFTFFERNIPSSKRWCCVSWEEPNLINWIWGLKVTPYVVFHAIISMLSMALKDCSDVTAADDALDFLVGGSVHLAEALLA
jgi:hypothetical protein